MTVLKESETLLLTQGWPVASTHHPFPPEAGLGSVPPLCWRSRTWWWSASCPQHRSRQCRRCRGPWHGLLWRGSAHGQHRGLRGPGSRQIMRDELPLGQWPELSTMGDEISAKCPLMQTEPGSVPAEVTLEDAHPPRLPRPQVDTASKNISTQFST